MKIVDLPKPEPCPRIIEALKEALSKAEAGKLRSAIVLGVDDSSNPYHRIIGDTRDMLQMLGLLSLAQAAAIESFCEDY